MTTLQSGSRGDEVRQLQELLKVAGFDPGTIDGIFGPKTQAALRSYQEAQGLPVTGIANDEVWAALQGTTPEQDTDLTSIMEGETTWYKDPSRPGVWFCVYKMPNSNRSIAFEATAAQMTAIFGEKANWPNSAGTLTMERIGRSERLYFGGEITEMAGEGSLEENVEILVASALENGELPDWLSNTPAAWDLLWIADTENKSDEWLLEQWSHLNAFKAHYVGLDSLVAEGLTLTEAIEAWNEFDTSIRDLWTGLGQDPASLSNEQIGGLLSAGHSLTSVTNAVSVWRRMQEYAPAMDAFNQILVQMGEAPLDQAGMISFLSGTAPAEMYDIYEASSFQESATAAGLSQWFGADDAIRVALQTPGVSEAATVTSAMQSAANLLLRLRHELDMGKFGLNHEDLIDVSLGLAPRSGATEASIRESVDRAVAEAQGWLNQRVKPYRSYSSQGLPRSGSLGPSRPSS